MYVNRHRPSKNHPSKEATSMTIISDEELNECDREPVHLIGHIQENCGNCIFVNFPEWEILAVDANIFELTFISTTVPNTTLRNNATMAAEDLVGINLQDIFPPDLFVELEAKVQSLIHSNSKKAYLFYQFEDCDFAVSTSSCAPDFSVVAFEIEKLNTEVEQSTLFQTYSSMSLHMHDYTDEKKIVQNACDRVFHLIGKYDRGMVYRFNDDNSGEVIHEIKKEHIQTSYLGLRFPSSDIPKSSRLLYLINRVRYIYNSELDPIKIIARDSIPIDQSLCQMRAVAKPHIIYLKQMGVISSMSIALIVDNELWGLFSFHSYQEPCKPSLQQRLACESVGAMASIRIEASLKKVESSRSILLGEQVTQLDKKKCVIQNISEWGTAILDILKSEIFVSFVENPKETEKESIVLGNSALRPTQEFWEIFRNHRNRDMVVSSSRKETCALGVQSKDCPACGFVYFREYRTHFFLGRSERSSDVCWGGKPDEPKLKINGILCPRKSFEMYMERSRMESKKWTKEDLSIISILRDRLCEHSHDWNMTLLEQEIKLSNQKYIAAIQRAQENYEFFAHMSHELRTPFHGVMGCLSLLNETISDSLHPDSIDLLNTAIASGNHMLNLLNDILKISKSNHLSHKISKTKLLYQEMAVQLVNAMTPFAMTRGISIQSEIEPQDCDTIIYVDSTKVTQIVTNCLNNAIKFAPSGSAIHIQIKLSPFLIEALSDWRRTVELHAGVVFLPYDGKVLHDVTSIEDWLRIQDSYSEEQWLILMISDTGCGIKATELSSMFAPYTQSSSGSNRNFQGTGLGLYISVSLCHLLNGFISSASTPKQGTSIAIGIPVKRFSNEVARSIPIHDKSENLLPINMTGGILIVDDNKINVKILRRTIEMECKKLGKFFEIACANGGEEAIEMYKTLRPSVCFIDYHMPDVDGVLTTKEIRKFEKENGILNAFIMSYTADATPAARDAVLASGANDIMTKPPPKGVIPGLINRMEALSG
jgi:two-component system, chemotaxis family, sensor kinase Cph1